MRLISRVFLRLYITLIWFVLGMVVSFTASRAIQSWWIAALSIFLLVLAAIRWRTNLAITCFFIGLSFAIGATTTLQRAFTIGVSIKNISGEVVTSSHKQLQLLTTQGKILLRGPGVSKVAMPWQTGARLSCRGKVQQGERRRIPGASDQRLQQVAEGAVAIAYVRHCQQLPAAKKASLALRYKRRVEGALAAVAISGLNDGVVMLRAMLLGEQQSLPEELKELFRRSGLYHLLVVSGSNLTLLAAFIYSITLLFFSLHAPLLNYLNRYFWAFVVASGGSIFYLAVIGDQAPVMRATLAGLVFLLSLTLRRPFLALHALALVVLMLLICRPHYIFSASFQLTVAATFGILLGMQQRGNIFKLSLCPQHNLLQRNIRRLATIWLLMGWGSLCAYVFTLPIIIFHFHRFSLWSLLCNWLYIPWIGWLILPLGFCGLLLVPLLPTLAVKLFTIAATLCELVVGQLRDLQQLPGMALQLATPSALLMIAWYMLLIFSLLRQGDEKRWLKGARAAALLLFIAALFDYCDWRWQRSLQGAVLDVGDGLAVVLEIKSPWYQFKGHQVVIIDTGQPRTCQSNLIAYLNHRGIQNIAAVYLSHWDADHAGCIAELVALKKVDKVFASYLPKPELLATLASLPQVIRSNTEHTYGDLRIATIFPPPGALVEKKPNNRSLVLGLDYFGRHLLFPGDIEKRVETKVLQSWEARAANVDILLAPHHGSKTSSSRPFVEALRPETLIISRRHPPGKGVVERYRRVGSDIFNTRQQGTILFELRVRKEVAEVRLRGYTCDRQGNPYTGWGICP